MKVQEILNNIPDKRDNKGTTTLQFKKDLIEFFKEKNINTIVELGTHQGYSTRILSYIFQNVITFDINIENSTKAQIFNKDRKNIEYHIQDAYIYPWWEISKNIDAIFVDTVHTYESVTKDIKNCLKIDNECYIIFDDYGLFEEVKKAVDEHIASGELEFISHVGESAGSNCRPGKQLEDWEGIICKNVKK